MARMPLKFRSTGVAFSSEETSKDCTAWSGGWTIGYIYYQAREEDRDEPLTWIWSMHGVPGKPPGMRPWSRADARRRASKTGSELAGVAAMGAPHGARAGRVKGTMRASRPHACVLDGKGVVFPVIPSVAAGWVRPYAVVGRFPLRQGDR